MMKNENEKQEDEGSTQSNASRYDTYTFYLFDIWFDCLPCEAWSVTCAYICNMIFTMCTSVI